MAGWGGRASASGRRTTLRKSSSPTSLIMSVARVIGILPWRILFSRSLVGFASKEIKRAMSPAEDEKDNERCVNGGAAG